MVGLKLTKFFRKSVISGMAAASIFGSPMPKVKTKIEGDDNDLNLIEDEGLIAPEHLTQGEWRGYSALDDHLYRYGSLENLVSHENEVDGRFWKTVKFSGEYPDTYKITGMRSDDVEFSVSDDFDIRDKHIFDQLCESFNKKLTVEIA